MSDQAVGPWRLRHFATIGSTSDLCRTLAEAGEPDGLAVLADRQTAGRGSRGRAWASPSGNLALSVLVRPREVARTAGQWALLAGVAVAEALSSLVPADDGVAAGIALKWPNDIMLEGRKAGGILLDSSANERGSIGWIVIGIGVNLASAPEVPGRRTASFADLGVAASAADVAAAILARLAHWRGMRLLEGFAPVRSAWLALAHPVGTFVTLRIGGGDVGGTFAGLGEDGSLLLQTGGRVRAFATGEVLLPELPTR